MDQFKTETREELERTFQARLNEKVALNAVSSLNDNDQNKFSCYMEIDFGEMEIGRLVGKIPMFFPDPKPNMDHLDEAEELLRNIAKESKMWIPKDKLYGKDNVIKTSILCAMYGHPAEDCRSQYVIVPASCILGGYYLDDEMCGDLVFTTVRETDEIMKTWSDVAVNIWRGKYERFEDVPQCVATAEAVLRLFWLLNKKYGHLLPPEGEDRHLRKAFEYGIHAAAAMRIEAVGHSCSGELYRRLRGGDSGVRILTEIIAAGVTHNLLDPAVRKHIYYKNLLDLLGQEGGLTNDVMGFVKEMHGNDIYYNNVLRSVEMEGMTYPQAFETTIKAITNQRKDIAILFEQIVEEFPEDERLVEMILLLKQMIDANVYVSIVSPRYGGMSFRELPIDS